MEETLVGVIVGFLLGFGVEALRSRFRRRSHWAALGAEIDYCSEMAATYSKSDSPKAPSYRLPTAAYANSLPALLELGDVGDSHKHMLAFYDAVESLNRGLELIEEARLLEDGGKKFDAELGRNLVKAKHLIPSSTADSYYDKAKAVVTAHRRWCRL